MNDDAIRTVAHMLAVLVIEVPALFALGYVLALVFVWLVELLRGRPSEDHRWRRIARRGLFLNFGMTVTWMLLLLFMAAGLFATEAPASSNQTVRLEPSLAVFVCKGFLLAWLYLFALATIGIGGGYLRLGIVALCRLVGRRLGIPSQ